MFEHPMDVQMMSSKGSSLQVPIWVSYLTTTYVEHPMDVQMMSSKILHQVPIWVSQPYLNTPWTCKSDSTSFYLTDTTYVPVPIWLYTTFEPVWTPHGRAKDVLKVIVYQFLFECPNPIWTPHGRAKDVLKMIVYQFLFDWTNPVWTPQGRPNDVLKGIVCQFLFDWHNICLNTNVQMIPQRELFDWHNTCLNTPWTSKWCPQRDPLQVPIWVSQPYLNTPWTCNRCPQSDRLPVPIWLTQHMFEHPMDVQMMSSKGSSTSSYLSVPTIFEHPMDVQKMSSKWSSTSSYLTNKNPVWTPKGHAKDILKGIVYQFLFDWHNICLNTPWTSKWCPQRDRLPVPIWVSQPYLNTPWTCNRCPQSDRLPVPIWLAQNLFGHPMDVQNMSSKWSSTSSYLAEPTLFEHHNDVQTMSSKGSPASSYLTDTTSVWTPHGRQNDVLKGIVFQFLFDWHNTCLNTPWTSKWCPQRDPLQVPIWVSQPYLNTPWTCNRCPQNDRLPVPIWLTQHLLEHPMNVQKMSSKWSSTCSYLTNTKPGWTPQGHAKYILKGIVYQFLFGWNNICLNTPWTSKWCPQRDHLPVPIWVSQPYLNTPWTCNRCPQSDRLPVPIWLTQHMFEHAMDVQMMSSKGSPTSFYLTDTTPVGTPHGRPNDVLKEILHKFLFECPNPIWTPHGRAKDVLKGIVYQFLFGWHNTCLNTPWTSKRCPQSDRLPVPIWLTQHLFEHPMDVQMMSSKGSSTSSYLTDTTPVGTPHGRPNDVLKEILHKFLFECPNPIWTPHGRAKDVLKMIVYQFLFDWHNTCLNTPWTCKRCLQNDRLPVPMWLTQNQFKHPKDMQKISSKGSSTSSYLTDTTSVWTPHGRPNDVLKGIIYQFLFECPNPIWTPHGRATDVLKVIVYQFLFDWHNICLDTPWTSKWCPQRDLLQVPIWAS